VDADEEEDGGAFAVSPQERARELAIRVWERDRAARRVGPGPYVLGLARDVPEDPAGHPFDLPVIAAAEAVRLDTPVTLLAGDNGTGKSTYLEALAEAMAFLPEGGELHRLKETDTTERDPERGRPGLVLGGARRPIITRRQPRGGYFLRGESFFNVAAFVDSGAALAPDLSLYGDVPLHGQSHGQSFLALASGRFGGEGLYLLDEPEAALSFSGLLALLAVIVRAARDGAQFVVATHSPVLLACPDARIYELDEDGVAECAYDDLQAVRMTRGFLADPARYLRAALDPE
jgi:predicted ATPase